MLGTVESPGYIGEKTDKILDFLVLIFLWKGQKVNCIYKPVNDQILASAVQVIEQLAPLD